jgi:hypothetical protein
MTATALTNPDLLTNPHLWNGTEHSVIELYDDDAEVNLWRKFTLWIVGCYIVLNVGFVGVRFPPTGAGLPIGEMVLVVSLLMMNFTVIAPRMAREVWLFPMLVWWGYCLPRALFDLRVGGAFALRDASQEIESLFLFVGFWLVNSATRMRYFFAWLRKILPVIGLYGLLFPIHNRLTAVMPTIPGMNGSERALFFQMVGTPTLCIWVATWLLMEGRQGESGSTMRYVQAGFLTAWMVAFSQVRSVYIQILAMVMILLAVRRRLAGKWITMVLMAILLIGAVSLSGLNLQGRMTKVSLDFVWRHLESSTGESEGGKTGGAAAGVGQRERWWSHIYEQMRVSRTKMVLGLGFGMPLTNFGVGGTAPVREPHDSYVSVFARLGILGILLWVMMQAALYRAWWRGHKLCARMGWIRDQNNLMLIMLYGVSMLLLAIAEDAFEKPYMAIPYYLFFGVLIRYTSFLREAAADGGPTLEWTEQENEATELTQ